MADLANRQRHLKACLKAGIENSLKEKRKFTERESQLKICECVKVNLADSELQTVHQSSSKMPAGHFPPHPRLIGRLGDLG